MILTVVMMVVVKRRAYGGPYDPPGKIRVEWIRRCNHE